MPLPIAAAVASLLISAAIAGQIRIRMIPRGRHQRRPALHRHAA